ncbi:MAG TPA: PQQ-dependent sugar dehydrogenase [Acidimicrobiales bacterium]
MASSAVTVTVTDNGSPSLASSVAFTWTVTAPGPTNQPPVVTSPGNRSSVQGSAIAPLAIAASDPDAGQTLAFAASGLPAGLALNAATGVITGTPSTVASSAVTVTVTDNGSPALSASTTFTWTVTAPTSGGSPLYRAINLNGPAVTAGGVAFEAGTTAPNLTAGPYSFCNQGVTLNPATDAGTATMVRCSVFGFGAASAQATLTNVPSGTYQVSLYTWEDDSSETFNVSLNGASVATNVVSGSPGTWKVLGPYNVNATTGTLAVTTSGGAANLSGIVVRTATGGPTNQPPVVTSPGNRSSVQGSAIAPLAIAASDPDAGQTLAFAASGLPAGLALNAATGVITGTPTTVASSSVTVTVTDNGSPALSASTTFTWTVTAPTGGGPSTVYRAVNLNGAAITAGGISYESGIGAPNLTAGPNGFCNQGVTLTPATDASTATLVRCSVWGTAANPARVAMTGIPNGSYQISLHAWEDNASQTIALAINGTTVQSGIVSGAAGSWRLLGPYPVTITDGTLTVSTSGGEANLSSLVVATAGAPTGTSVAITAPASGASVARPTTIQGAAADPTGIDHVHLQIRDGATNHYWNGTAFQVAAAEVLATLASAGATTTAWSYSFNPPTISVQPYQLTATAHGTGGAESNPSTSTFSLSSGGGGGGSFDPTKVTDTFVAGGNWTLSVSADWLANGHMVVLTQGGIVFDVNPATGAQTQILNITSKVYSEGESGSLDILADAAGTGFYIYYMVAGSDRLRISHFTAGSSVEQVIWTHSGLGYAAYHNGGSINLGPDGKLYLGIGDRVEGRSNDLTNVFGKILRINTDGSAPSDNPFHDGAGPNIDEIWAYGLRNPYRSNFDDTTGLLWTGDVGGNVDAQAYEEVDIIERGQRYGWPDCEGPLAQPKNGPVCPTGVTGPVFSYPHDSVSAQYFNRAIVGGEIYRGSAFPLGGYYVYADYPTDSFHWLQLGVDGRTAVANGQLATVSSPTPVWLGAGPDGNIYWLSLGFEGNGQLRRLGYTGATDQPPTITTATATPTTGTAPLAVNFTGAASDPNGTPVSYAWDFGDGTTSTEASPTHVFSAKGSFQARLQVSSGGATVSSDLIPIVVGTPPVPTITAPVDGSGFNAGDTITITGAATDPDGGAVPASGLAWNIQFLHNDHAHPGVTGTGPSIAFPIPRTGHDFSGDTRYRVELTATDTDGLTSSTSIILRPNKTTVAVSSNQATTMTVDNVAQNLPFGVDTVVGFQHSISVPATQCVTGRVWNFSSWSDGGARTHTITATAGQSLTATYTSSATSCSTIGEIRYSRTSNRASPLTLQGATLPGGTSVYIFLTTTTQNFTRVEFWIDQPTTATPRRVDTSFPYDLVGGNASRATAFNPGTLSVGTHTLTVRATRSDGTSQTIASTFVRS